MLSYFLSFFVIQIYFLFNNIAIKITSNKKRLSKNINILIIVITIYNIIIK